MTARALTLAAVCALAAGGMGCGSGGGGGPNPNDKRRVALQCITDRGLEARLAGEKSILVNGAAGPRVEFFVSSGEAEARQFQGEAQGAEQVGAALLFVNGAGDRVLEQVEGCLAQQ